LGEGVTTYLKEVFTKIAEEYGFSLDTMEVAEDHVHIFAEAPPRYSKPVTAGCQIGLGLIYYDYRAIRVFLTHGKKTRHIIGRLHDGALRHLATIQLKICINDLDRQQNSYKNESL
jgi:REP element-mobilizing transposase RayT